MAFVVKKNPTQKFQYTQGMISGTQFKEHMAHLRSQDQQVGKAQPGTAASPNKQ